MTELVTSCRNLLVIAWGQHSGRLVTAVLLMVSGAAAAPLSALAIRSLVDQAVAGRPGPAVLAGSVGAVLVVAALTCGNFAHIAYFELAESSMIEYECRLARLSNGSPGIAHHERPGFADKMIVVRQGLRRLRTVFASLLGLSGSGVTMVITALLLAQLDPLLLLLIPLAVPPLLTGRWAERIIDAARIRTAGETRAALGVFRLTTEAGPAKEIRLLRLQDELVRRHHGLWTSVTRQMSNAYLRATTTRCLGQVVFTAGYLLALLVVVRAAVAGERTVGDVVLAITLATQVNAQVAGAVSLVGEVQAFAITTRHLDEVREAVGAVDPGPAAHQPPPTLSRGIELSGVTFAYPGAARPVLRDITITLPAGATVAVVGENGAGKSTLVKLLSRMHEPTAGRITVDGIDLADITASSWRERLSANFQDFARFEFTAQEAIGVGDLRNIASSEAVLAALESAQYRHLVDELPDGLATHIGKRHTDGVELSGGQWQRVALGRSFMRSAPLLVVLDEPTAALDAETEHSLFQRYADAAKRMAARAGTTTVLVSHRFSTVRMADLIIVLAGGRIVEVGDHKALMEADEHYADLFGLQAKAFRG